ncbi:MAG TPA: hypothetical protein VF950_13775 [Planctomycetota bacterium]
MRVTFIFWLPLALSVVGTAYFLFFTEEDRKWKALMTALTVASLILQFGFTFQVHFAIPAVLQLIVCVWTIIYWKLDQ